MPGYGMAVAQAQHAVRELADVLEKKGIQVDYAIHPVAGRMPGHMNVLLAEANVPYPALKEMDEINPQFPQTDVSLVIGANDVVNPAARNEPGSPIYGMPILNVDQSKQVVVMKRSMATGLRRHRQPALRRAEHGDAVRRREGVGAEARLRRQGALTRRPGLHRRGTSSRPCSPERAVEACATRSSPTRAASGRCRRRSTCTNYPGGRLPRDAGARRRACAAQVGDVVPGQPGARPADGERGRARLGRRGRAARGGDRRGVGDGAADGAAAVLAAETLGRADAATRGGDRRGRERARGRADVPRARAARSRSGTSTASARAARPTSSARDVAALARRGARGRPASRR